MVDSLENLCKIPSVIVISNFPEVKKQIFSFSSIQSLKTPSYYEEWKDSLKGVIKKILEGFNPVLKDLIPWYLFPLIGSDMIKLAIKLKSKFELNLEFTEKFISSAIFTSEGTIVESTAARELAKADTLSHIFRFKIACFYFLEDIINDLWQKLHDVSMTLGEVIVNDDSEEAVIIWSRYLYELTSSDTKFYEEVFIYSLTTANSEAIKFYLRSNTFRSTCETTYKRSLFRRYLNSVSDSFKNFSFFKLDFLLSLEFKNYLEFLIVLFLKNSRKIGGILFRFDLAFNFVKVLLFWPLQEIFVEMATWFIHCYYLNEEQYYLLLHFIVDLIDDKDLGESYNYRLLLKEFWIESPSEFKEYVLNVESGTVKFDLEVTINPNIKDENNGIPIVTKLFLLSKFTYDDECNFLLITKSASNRQKIRIVEFNENFARDCVFEILTEGKFKLANVYIGNLILDEHYLKIFKKNAAANIIGRFVTDIEDLDFADQVLNWAAYPEGTENLKTEIFARNFEICNLATLYIECEFSLDFLTKLFKWFLQSDEKILEWKRSSSFNKYFCEESLDFKEKDRKNFDKFLIWVCRSSRKVTKMKSKMLRGTFREICRRYRLQAQHKELKRNILYLCSYNKKLIVKFTDDLNAWCTQKNEESSCIFCEENEIIYGRTSPRFRCFFHGVCGASSKERREAIMSSLLKELIDLLLKHQIKLSLYG